MRSLGLPFLGAVYRSVPSLPIRRRLFGAFCFAVRPLKLVARVDGIRYDLDLSEMIDLALLLRQFEPHTAAAFRRYVQPGWTVLDIGANIGAHALPLTKLTGPTGRVFAFEPTDYAYRKLVRNISLNEAFSNVYAVKAGLSNRNLYQQEVKLRATWPTRGKPVIEPGKTDFRRLDNWCAENGVDRVDLMKIDVDGHEYEVLDGSRELLSRCLPLILIETGWYHFSEASKNPIAVLNSLGYRFLDERKPAEFASLDEIERKLKPAGGEEPGTINLIAIASPRE